MARAKSVQLEKTLNEVVYPVSKKDLIRYAEEKGADEAVLRALKQLPSRQYETLADLKQVINPIDS